jgi:hypothetical protein
MVGKPLNEFEFEKLHNTEIEHNYPRKNISGHKNPFFYAKERNFKETVALEQFRKLSTKINFVLLCSAMANRNKAIASVYSSKDTTQKNKKYGMSLEKQ